MRLNTLEATIPGFREAREREMQNRALAFAGLSHGLCGVECVQLTPRHRLEFQLVGNAFAVGLRPMQGDVFQFLWRLNPAWRKGQPITLRSTVAWLKIKRLVKRGNIDALSLAVATYVAGMMQDLPESREHANTSNPPENYVHWMAAEAAFYARHFQMGLAEYQSTPYLVLQQLHRAHRLAFEEDATFINESDRLVGDWQKAVAERNRRENSN